MGHVPAGWYPDPVTVGASRFWNGTEWTNQVAWGPQRVLDPTPLVDVTEHQVQRQRDTVQVYLDAALARCVVDAATVALIEGDLAGDAAREGLAKPLMPSPVISRALAPPIPPPPAPVPAPLPTPVPTVAPPHPRQVPAPIERRPGRISLWWARTGEAISSDLAVHWLSYLGVLLMFAGVVGLIVVSTGDVEPVLRPVAEAAAPLAIFLAAWFLRSRRAATVAAALTLLGGAVLPIVVVASLTDGTRLPPDLSGTALPIASFAGCAAIAAGFVALGRRNRHSPFRFLAAPVLWLGVALGAAILRDPVPVGQDVARPVAAQVAAMMLAVAATVVGLRLSRSRSQLARATMAVAVPFGAALFVVETILASTNGWPVASGLATMAAAAVSLEALSKTLGAKVASVGQAIVIFVAGLRLSPEAEPAWVFAAVATALVLLVEYSGRRRPTALGVECTGALALAASVLSVGAPGAGATSFGVLFAWSLGRRARPPVWMPVADPAGIACGVTLAALVAEVGVLTNGAVVSLILGAVSAVGASAAAVRRGLRSDLLWRWGVPASAVGAVAWTAFMPWAGYRWECAAASALASIGLAGSGLPAWLRAWATALVSLWSLALLAAATNTGLPSQAVALAVIALACVVAGSLLGGPVTAQLALIGHLAGGAAIAVPTHRGWAQDVALAAATAGWVFVSAVHERRGAPHVLLLARLLAPGDRDRRSWVSSMPVLLAALGAVAAAMSILDDVGVLGLDSPWSASTMVAVAALLGASARVVGWRRANPVVLSYSAWALSLVAVSSAAGSDAVGAQWPTIVMLAASLAVALLIRQPRAAFVDWVSWLETAPLVVLLVGEMGLDDRYADTAVAVWGAVLAIGALAGRRILRRIVPPFVLGTVGFLLGAVVSLIYEAESVVGWHLVAYSVPFLAAALLLPRPSLVAVAELVGICGVLIVLPWEVADYPWSLVVWAAVLMVVASVTRARVGRAEQSGPNSPHRWAVPSFVSAHLLLAGALLLASGNGSVGITYAAAAALLFVVGSVLRSAWWPAAGAVLLLVASWDVGLGLFALALALEGLAVTGIGLRMRSSLRVAPLALGAAQVTGAWVSAAAWAGWDVRTVMIGTAGVACGLLVGSAWSLRLRVGPADLATVWLVAGVGWSVGVQVLAVHPDVSTTAGGIAAAVDLAALAVAAATVAALYGQWARWVATPVGVLAGARFLAMTELGAVGFSRLAAGTGVALSVLVLVVCARRPASRWTAPALGAVAMIELGAFLTAGEQLPDRGPMAIVLLAAAVQAAVSGTISRRPVALMASPILACTAWLVWASEAWDGEPNWFTVPIGLTILVVVAMIRRMRREWGGRVTGEDVAIVEIVGMAVIVGPPLVQTLTGRLGHVLLAIAAGVLLTVWGATTRVRRRCLVGSAAIALALVIVVVVPLARQVPTWRGPALWLALIGLGVAALLVAAFFEQGRRAVRRWRAVFEEVSKDWEHIGGPEAHR